MRKDQETFHAIAFVRSCAAFTFGSPTMRRHLVLPDGLQTRIASRSRSHASLTTSRDQSARGRGSIEMCDLPSRICFRWNRGAPGRRERCAVQNLLRHHTKETGIMAPRRGLIRSAVRTAGRTALIAGTATAVSGRVANRQREAVARRQEAESAQAAPGAFHGPTADGTDLVSRLHQLADLKAMGALTDKEFTAAKTRLLQE